MGKKTKIIHVKAPGLLQRIFTLGFMLPKVEKTINQWTKQGWTLVSNIPVADRQGKIKSYVLTFQKD